MLCSQKRRQGGRKINIKTVLVWRIALLLGLYQQHKPQTNVSHHSYALAEQK